MHAVYVLLNDLICCVELSSVREKRSNVGMVVSVLTIMDLISRYIEMKPRVALIIL